MISYLIPVYNFDIRELVKDLINLSEREKINYEILVVDDFSTAFKSDNKELLNTLNNVIYEELSENYGRAKIRNYLANKSQYENLVFLDCDSKINLDFVKNYIDNIDKDIVYGGTLYENNKSDQYYLHRLYGSRREVLSLNKRIESPILSFRTNNFLIKKSLFKKTQFDEQIKGYGHEDTLFAIEIAEKGVEIIHIDNPVIHIGLETSDVFIAKVLKSVENLHQLIYLKKELLETFQKIKLVRYFFKIKKIYLCGLFSFFYNISNKLIINILKTKKAKIFLLDFLKLTYICKKEKQFRQ